MAQIYISIGSNVDKEYYIPASLKVLEQHFGKLIVSSIFESEAVGFDGNNFYNLVVACQTQFDLEQTCALLKKIELEHGRTQQDKKFSPRTLDLDLLLFDDIICQQPAQLPRDEITKNAFVLWPLAEVAGQQLHPIEQKTYAELWHNYDKSAQNLWKVELIK